MTSTLNTSNQRLLSKTSFPEQNNYCLDKKDSNFPSFFNPNHLSKINFSSNMSNKNFKLPLCFSSLYSFKNEQDNELFLRPFFPILNKNIFSNYGELQSPPMSQQNSKFNSKISAFGLDTKKFFESQNLILNFDEPGKEKEKTNNEDNFSFKNENNNNQQVVKNKIILNDNNNDNNIGTKFFTNHNYGYKCSCSKTHCNRKYCECLNSGNYCIDCNCKNCENQPPINTFSNKRPKEMIAKIKKNKEICTCTKSGCNKNYCECYKSGKKCSFLCRCIGCENTEENNNKVKNILFYDSCKENSIYILKNQIIIEKLENTELCNREKEINKFESIDNKNEKRTNKKRKRDENKKFEEEKSKNIKIKKKNDNFLFSDSLFDENGKVILRHNILSYQ